jgi:septal ring factor EnvC (AmiA/AmiB activator)
MDEKFESKFEKFEDKLDKIDKKFEGKFDTLQKDVADLKVGQATLTEKVGSMDKGLEKVESEQDTMVKAISDLQGFRSLILPVVVGGLSAVIGAVLTAMLRWLYIGTLE